MNESNVALWAPRALGIELLVYMPPFFYVGFSDVVDDGVLYHHVVCEFFCGLTGLFFWAESFTFTESPCN